VKRAAAVVAFGMTFVLGCHSTAPADRSKSPNATSSVLPPPPTLADSSASTRPPAPRREFAECHNGPFSIKTVKPVSPMTGEHAFVVQLAYTGSAPCTLRGYPRITFYGASGTALPFTYRDGSGPYVTHSAPTYVNLRPADTAFFEVAKYRCDVSGGQTAVRTTAQVPGERGALYPHIHAVASIDYCDETPSKFVYLSPVEASEAELYEGM
jgi:hypothetical protein